MPAPVRIRPPRAFIVALWLMAALILLPLGAGLEARLDTDAHVRHGQAERAAALIEREFDTVLADPIILVIEGLNPAHGPAEAGALSGLSERLRGAASGVRTLSHLDGADPLFIGADGDSTLLLVDLPGSGAAHAAELGALQQAAARYMAETESSFALHWTSEALVNHEMREISARDATLAEMRVLPLALLVLLIAFGSVTAGVTPVVIGFLVVGLARGALALIDSAFPLSVLTANVATMLGLGLSVDYALLVVSRFREQLAHMPARAAAAATFRSAGATVALSGLGVAISLAALMIVPINEVQSIGIAGLIVVGAAVVVCATLLPAMLSLIGSRIDVLMPLRQRFEPTANALWRLWARLLFKHPIAFAALASAPLVALALHAARLDISLPRGDWLPKSARAAGAMEALDRIGRTGILQTIHVLVELEAPASSEQGWSALAGLSARIAQDPRVEATRSITTAAGSQGWRLFAFLPEAAVGTFLSQDARTGLITATPRADLELHELSQLARDLRAAAIPDGVAAVSVGGAPALTADYIDTVSRWFVPVAAVILVVTFIVLAYGLRSLLLPLKAIALNLLSVAAALGAMTLVFQDGLGGAWLGLDAPAGAVFPIVPILVFSIVFGLSMDYEVFLFARVVEAHRSGASDLDAMTAGLRATAGVITSAAALMVIVFGAFMLGDFLLMKMLGFSLAAAIIIDALLVRLILGPAMFAIAGRWNWWPFPNGRVRRIDATVPVG